MTTMNGTTTVGVPVQRQPGAFVRPAAGAARTRAGVRSLDLDRVQLVLLVVGSVLLPLGLSAVVVGWYGAAHTPYAFEQVPYMISGGLLGIALVLVGGFLYFGSWLARSATLARRDADRMLDALERISGLIPVGASAGRPLTPPSLVATSSGSMMHRPECPIVVNRDDVRSVGGGEGLAPCRLCDPLGVAA